MKQLAWNWGYPRRVALWTCANSYRRQTPGVRSRNHEGSSKGEQVRPGCDPDVRGPRWDVPVWGATNNQGGQEVSESASEEEEIH